VVFSGERKQSVMEVIKDKSFSSAAVSRRLASKWPKPVWHAPWKCYRVISGHLG
jgi:pleiotropic regulator 1